MEPSPERKVYIYCTCSYTFDGAPLPSVRPQVLSIQKMSISDKVRLNGYRWMRVAGFIWLSPDEFQRLYGSDWKDLVGQYSLDWLRRLISPVASD